MAQSHTSGRTTFQEAGQAQKFLSSYSALYNTFNFDRHLISRQTLRQFRAEAADAWKQATAAA